MMILALLVVIALTVRDHDLLGQSGTLAAVVMWACAPGIGVLRMKIIGAWSGDKVLWTSAALFVWVVICGLGRPALLLDMLFVDKANVPQRLIQRCFFGQVIFVIGVIGFLLIDALASGECC
jgi:hypothetical protein